MKIQDFEVEIVRELIPGESYTVSITDPATGEASYENLRILDEHFALSEPFKVGHQVSFKGAVIVISGTDVNINTSMIVTQSPLTVVKSELSTLKCTINNVIIDDYIGQFFTARILETDVQIKSDYVNLTPSNMVMKGIKKGVTITVKGKFYSAKVYIPNNRRSTIPLFIIKQFEIEA